jgi:hypothetical protein
MCWKARVQLSTTAMPSISFPRAAVVAAKRSLFPTRDSLVGSSSFQKRPEPRPWGRFWAFPSGPSTPSNQPVELVGGFGHFLAPSRRPGGTIGARCHLRSHFHGGAAEPPHAGRPAHRVRKAAGMDGGPRCGGNRFWLRKQPSQTEGSHTRRPPEEDRLRARLEARSLEQGSRDAPHLHQRTPRRGRRLRLLYQKQA